MVRINFQPLFLTFDSLQTAINEKIGQAKEYAKELTNYVRNEDKVLRDQHSQIHSMKAK